jgi:hypothetical protein
MAAAFCAAAILLSASGNSTLKQLLISGTLRREGLFGGRAASDPK